jgi:hypothetical protein
MPMFTRNANIIWCNGLVKNPKVADFHLSGEFSGKPATMFTKSIVIGVYGLIPAP